MNELDAPSGDVDGTLDPSDPDTGPMPVLAPGSAAGSAAESAPRAADGPRPRAVRQGAHRSTDKPAEHSNPSGTIALAVVVGIVLLLTARAGFVGFLVAVAGCQALLTFSFVFGTAIPGRKGAVVLAALAAAGADTAIALRPGSGMSAVLPVIALLIPAMFVHQLMRGAARNRVVRSLGSVAALLVAVVSFSALLSLSREFATIARGGQVAGAVALVMAVAVIVALFTDLVIAKPRFDAEVGRGMVAVILAAIVGGLVAAKALGGGTEFVDGRGLFVGAAVAALVALFGVAAGFLEHTTSVPTTAFGRRIRPVFGAMLPLAYGSPIALLICLAIRA